MGWAAALSILAEILAGCDSEVLHVAVPIAVIPAPGKDLCLEKMLACNE